MQRAAIVMRRYILFGLLASWILPITSCRSPGPPPAVQSVRHGRDLIITPVVAVMAFENRGGFASQWNIGEGMADLLSAALLDSGKVWVVERKNIQDVLGEIQRQGTNLFREEGRALRGRLRNARYLIRGTVTDFTILEGGSGWFNIPWLFFGGNRVTARVAIAMQVVDVENGDVLGVVKADGKASAGGASARINYRDVSFGGDSFFRTPLGKATGDAIESAVRRLLRTLPEQPWTPMVAEVRAGEIMINGGLNAHIRPGSRYAIQGPERVVTDPITGNIIHRAPGGETGRVEVIEVYPQSSRAKILSGSAERGNRLLLVVPPPAAPDSL